MTSINPDTTDIEVTQADREAVEQSGLWLSTFEKSSLAAAFARHRLSSKGIEPPMSPPAIAPEPVCQFVKALAEELWGGGDCADTIATLTAALEKTGLTLSDVEFAKREIATEQGASVQEGIPYKGDAVMAVQTLLEKGMAHVDMDGNLVSGPHPNTTPSRIAPTEQEILELAREDWARVCEEDDCPREASYVRKGHLDTTSAITSRVSVLTLAVEEGWGK